MSVHRTPYGTWRVVWYLPDRRQKSKTFKMKREAERFDLEVKTKKEGGTPIRLLREAPSLRDFAADWLARKSGLAPTTLDSYIGCLERHVLPFLGDLRVHPSDLAPEVLEQWVSERAKAGVGAPVLRRSYIVLRQILKSAVLPHRLLELNPITSVSIPDPGDPDHKFLTAEGVEAIRNRFLGEGDVFSATLVSVLGYVGIRPQDALALRWSDVGEKLTVHRKNVDGEILAGSKSGLGYRRTVEIPAQVAKDLDFFKTQGGEAKEETALIFARGDGEPFRKTDFDNWRNRKFRVAVRESGVDVKRPYDLRHTCASLLAAAGKNHLEIAHQLGNKPETAVRFYQHLIELEGGRRIPIDEQIRMARVGLSS